MNEFQNGQILRKSIWIFLIFLLLISCTKKRNTATGTLASTVPESPTNLTIQLISDASVTLSWDDIANDELIYEIYQCTGAGCSEYSESALSPLKRDSTSVTISGLSPNTIYNFRIRATGIGGSSNWLTSGDISTQISQVLPPTSLNIVQKDDISVQLSWIDNATNETSYQLERCAGANCNDFLPVSGVTLTAGTQLVTVEGLSPSTSYRFQIRAVNSTASSSYLTSNNIITAPARPTNFATYAINPTSIDFSWTDNATDESGYQLERCSGIGCTIFSTSPTSPLAIDTISHSESGLIENNHYQFRVRAYNANGASGYLTGPILSTLIAAPTNLSVIWATQSSIQLLWSDISNVETGFEIQRCNGVNCTNFATLPSSPLAVNATGFTDTGLTSSSSYKYRIRTLTATGSSNWLTSSDIATGPLAPTDFTLGSVTHNSISFAWTDNATNEINYQIERCIGSGCNTYSVISNTLPSNTTGFSDTMLSGSTVYKYRIRALGVGSGSDYLITPEITTETAPIAAASCSNPNHLILDYGNKSAGTLASSSRGLFTDINYIPLGTSNSNSSTTGDPNGKIVNISSNIGSAYIDTGAQAIKYSYWNGTSFSTEVVAGDSVANVKYLNLVYLSNSPNTGLPLIFWTNGAANNGQILMAVRSTNNHAISGTWTVQVIDSGGGVTNRALAASVNPNDEVALVYQGTTSNLIRFIYCTGNCQNPNNYTSMPGGNRLDTSSLANQVQMGIGWCQHSAGAYSPAVVFGTTATTFTYASCLSYSSTPTGCLSAVNWTKSATPVTVGAGSGLVSDLHLDPSILRDTPKIILKDNAAGLKTYTLPSCDTFTSGTAYTGPGATITTATVANAASSFVKILKHTDYLNITNDRFFLVYNDGITSMRWSATANSNNFGGSWLSSTGAESAIHTNAALLAAAGTTRMGAAINPFTGQILTGYGTSIANNFNITLGVVDGYLSPADPSSATNNSYYQMPIESTGAIQLNATQYKNIALASTSNSKPAVAWVDFSSGVYTTGRLKFALRSTSSATGEWKVINVPGPAGVGAASPLYPSLAFDNNNLPWLGYWDQTALRFVLATNTKSDGTGTWTSYMFPLTGAANYGAPVGQPAANMTAVAMYYSGGVAYPVMIVINNSTTTPKAVRAAKLNPTTGKWSSPVNIDGSLSVSGANYLSANYDTSGKIVIAYQNLGTGAIRIKYSASTDGGLTWPTNSSTPYSVSSLNSGEGAKIMINPVTGLPSIAYYDRANNKLFLSTCSSNCTGSGMPTFTGTATSILNGIGISNLSGTGNANLLTAALTFSSSGDSYILYNSGQLDFGSLMMIDNVGGTMPSGLPSTIVGGNNGTYNTVASSATNGGIPWGQEALRLANGVLAIAYITPGNWLGVTTCGD